MLESAGEKLLTLMRDLHEGGVHVDEEVIHDRVPMMNRWSDQYHVLDVHEYRQVMQVYGYRSENENGCYLEDRRVVLVKNPQELWDALSKKRKLEYRLEKSLETTDAAAQYFCGSILNSSVLEEFIHRLFDKQLIEQHLQSHPSVSINNRTINFFNEAMTKVLVAETLDNLGKPHIIFDEMTDILNRLSAQKLARIVFFGSNSSASTAQVLDTIQQTLLSEYSGLTIEQILGEDGYLLDTHT